MRRLLLDHLELWLSAIGLMLIFGISFRLRNHAEFWQTAAITAIIIGMLHGVTFWLIRRSQRHVRQRAIADIREMLQDVVLNQLASITISAHLLERQAVAPKYIERIHYAVTEITGAMNSISDESLMNWQDHYSNMEDIAKARQEPTP